MSDEDDRGDRDNVGRPHKPEQASDRDKAPRGHLGTRHVSPGLGGQSSRRHETRTREQGGPEKSRIQFRRPEQEKGPAKDGMFVKTGDREVDTFYGKDQKMVSREEAEKMKAREIAKKIARDRDQDKSRGR